MTTAIGSLSLQRLAWNVLFWIGAFTYVLAVRYYQIGSIAFLNLPVEIPTYRIYVNGLILGLPVGVLYSVVEVRLESVRFYDKSLLQIILLRTLYLFLVCGATLAVVAYLNFLFDVRARTIDPSRTTALQYIFSATVRLLMVGALIGNLFLSVFHTLRSKIGYQDFGNLLLGRYRTPREEQRAFMFLDLKSSTTIAERLGHRTYSRLIQDSFRDLTDSLIETGAEVYQYVGDEAVLSWPVEKAVEDANCIRAYYLFRARLERKQAQYQARYGLVPAFKAGVNMGAVTVVEVGVLKRAIVYHSDVLNTAARIQALCNEHNESLLISDDVRARLPGDSYRFVEIGDILLKGKSRAIKIFAVRETISDGLAARPEEGA